MKLLARPWDIIAPLKLILNKSNSLCFSKGKTTFFLYCYCIYKYVISVFMSDPYSWINRPIHLKFSLGTRENQRAFLPSRLALFQGYHVRRCHAKLLTRQTHDKINSWHYKLLTRQNPDKTNSWRDKLLTR